MKALLFFMVFWCFTACQDQHNEVGQMQKQIDSLQHRLDESYTPGLGEFMSSIQVHHAKLWFSGIQNNWKLAEFEVVEIRESLDDIKKFITDRPEVSSIEMIDPALENLTKAIQAKNTEGFKTGYELLTNTCNKCHMDTAHEFNLITVPASPPFSNQRFTPVQ